MYFWLYGFNRAINYDLPTIDDGSCAYCTDNYLTLNMYDSFGDGWNGNTLTMTNSSGAMMVFNQTLQMVPLELLLYVCR